MATGGTERYGMKHAPTEAHRGAAMSNNLAMENLKKLHTKKAKTENLKRGFTQRVHFKN